MKLTLTVDEQHLKVSPKIFLEIIIAGTKIHMNNWNMYLCLQDSEGGRQHCHQDRSQVTGWSYYLWVLDVYPAMAGGVAKMRKEEEEET